ncbi:hypothetical protein N7499_001339 [Penicillium canescens]|nr:hypothetical protein N7444_010069 [Penicillium canescens]KAJ6101709.1 hypothetical protein N7499_001339 [Penicillium canescens]KAJ6174171.1 hypothetical protein N7485_006983 [Penicillium canescens]
MLKISFRMADSCVRQRTDVMFFEPAGPRSSSPCTGNLCEAKAIGEGKSEKVGVYMESKS